MISVVAWRWGNLFSTLYVERLRNMLARHLHIPHQLYCVSDDATAIQGVVMVAAPTEFADTPRCRRRMWQFDRARRADFGPRMLCIDLDVVIVDDITRIVDRPEPIVFWKVAYADVFSGSFHLSNTGAMDGAWQRFKTDPAAFLKETGEHNASDQAMLNTYLRGRDVAHWTEADGFVTWFGNGYARLEHHGMGPGRPELPPDARVVVLGSADKAVMDDGRYAWVREHWQ